MSTCLVTKLKGAVNNSSLPIFDAITLYVDTAAAAALSQSYRYFKVKGENTGTALILKNIGGVFCDSEGTSLGAQITASFSDGTKTVYYSDTTSKILLVGKDNIRECITYVSGTHIGVVTARFADFNMSSVYNCTLGGATQVGDLSEIKDNRSMRSLTINTTSITGDVADLAKIGLTSMVISNSMNIHGDFASWAIYRSAGTCTVICSANQVKCNGVYLSSGNHTLTFDGNGNVSAS